MLMTEAMGNVAREMPRYKSHKQVWALKIKSITPVKATIEELETLLGSKDEIPVEVLPSGEIVAAGVNQDDETVGAMIEPEEDGYAQFPVSRAYVRKHNPQVGGYYVVYSDGYKSWSPAQAFQEGYTRV